MSQAVAFPSLVLREITPDLLREVVAPAVSLEAISPSQAKTLFDRVAAEVWLVTGARPDRRASMIARAVVHADRCGLLPELLQRTTAPVRQPPPGPDQRSRNAIFLGAARGLGIGTGSSGAGKRPSAIMPSGAGRSLENV
jgi:hypothetical protein